MELLMREIRKIEDQHNVTVIWAGFTGSKLKGYSSPTSDSDFQLIHIPKNPLIAYTSNYNIVEDIKIKNDELRLDVSSRDLRKMVHFLRKGNVIDYGILMQPNLISTNFDVKAETILNHIADLAYQPKIALFQHSSMARSLLEKDKIIPVKQFLQGSHSALSLGYMLRHNLSQPPPVNIIELLDTLGEYPEYKDSVREIRYIVELRRIGEDFRINPLDLFDFKTELVDFMEKLGCFNFINAFPEREINLYEINRYFTTMISYFDKYTVMLDYSRLNKWE